MSIERHLQIAADLVRKVRYEALMDAAQDCENFARIWDGDVGKAALMQEVSRIRMMAYAVGQAGKEL